MLNIPVFEALISDDDCGIDKISLVDLPAVESNFVAFKKEDKQPVKFSIENEEQRMIVGVIMRANFLIYRYEPDVGEYYIKYSPQTIKLMAEKMMTDGNYNNINLMHMDGTDVEGVNLVQLFIKDTEHGIDPTGFEDIENGSLFATYKVNNDEIWDAIKAGTFAGFSLEGWFSVERQQLRSQVAQAKHEKNSTLMTRLFNKFLKSFVKCGSMITTDGKELFWVGDADLQIGDELFYNTESEEAVKVDDGEYTLNDGTTITVTDGLVSAITEADGKPEDSLDSEVSEEMAEKEKPAEEQEPEKQDDPRIAELESRIAELEVKYNELEAKYNELVSKPAAEPMVEEYEKITKSDSVIPKFGSKSRLSK